jgi:SAM-dependent methyltransferase
LKSPLTPGAASLYAHPAYYDKVYRARRSDVDFYVRTLAGTRANVLELGAGSGRVSLALARAGVNVTAVDTSDDMLSALRERLKSEPLAVQRRVRVERGDMRDVDLGATFRWVIAPFNTVLHLYTLEDVAGFLATAKRHLKPRGELLFDYATPRVRDLAVDPERWFKGGSLIDPDSGKRVRYAERFHYSPQRQVLSTWLHFAPVDGTAPWELLLTHRQFFPLEMRVLLAHHGFSRQEWSADFSDAQPSALSDVLVVRCRPGRS